MSNFLAIKWADSSPLQTRCGPACISVDFQQTSGRSAWCTFCADSCRPAADSTRVRHGPENLGWIRGRSASSTRWSGGLFWSLKNCILVANPQQIFGSAVNFGGVCSRSARVLVKSTPGGSARGPAEVRANTSGSVAEPRRTRVRPLNSQFSSWNLIFCVSMIRAFIDFSRNIVAGIYHAIFCCRGTAMHMHLKLMCHNNIKVYFIIINSHSKRDECLQCCM